MNTLRISQFSAAITRAKDTFKTLKSKHPTLNAYLVLSLPKGQAGIDESPDQLLTNFPEMVVDDEVKTEAEQILKALKKAEGETERKRLKNTLDEACKRLRFLGECQVELRFKDLNYDLIERLKQDELIDKNLTPRSRASIRIVLGTLDSFSEVRREKSANEDYVE